MRPTFPESGGLADFVQSVEGRLSTLERMTVSSVPGEPFYNLEQAIGADARSTSYFDANEAEIPVKEGYRRLAVSVVLLVNSTAGTTGGELHGALSVDLGGTPEEAFGTVVSLDPGQAGLSVTLLDINATEWPMDSFTVTGRFKWSADPGAGTTVRTDLHVSTNWYPV